MVAAISNRKPAGAEAANVLRERGTGSSIGDISQHANGAWKVVDRAEVPQRLRLKNACHSLADLASVHPRCEWYLSLLAEEIDMELAATMNKCSSASLCRESDQR